MLHSFKYGYVSHTNQRGLYKLDLANMRYVRSIDLAPYSCVPRNMQFSALCKFFVNCFSCNKLIGELIFITYWSYS